MAERPPGKGGPPEGSPEYNWLYGKKGDTPPDDATRAVPRPQSGGGRPGSGQGAEHTRVMPSVPPGGNAEPGTRTSRATPPPPSPPPGGTTYRSKGRGWRPRFRLRWLWALLLVWVLFLVAVPLWAWSKVDKVEAFPEGDRPDDQPGTTFLMVGSDSRGDLSAEERKQLGTGNASGQRTDTIMVLHTGSGPNLLMSIPRDSLVEVPGHGTTKINAAYSYGGAKLLTRTIEGATGIRIDHYVEIGFGGFVDLVDAVGGVEICPPFAMKDPLAKINLEKGCQEADGPTALGYARSRKTDTKYGDLGRVGRQREVVSAIGKKAMSPWSVLNPVRYYNLNMAAPEALAVSDGTSAFTMVRWAFAMTRVNGDNGLTCSVPVRDFAVHWDEQRSKQMFQAIIEDDTDSIGKDLCTPTGLPR